MKIAYNTIERRFFYLQLTFWLGPLGLQQCGQLHEIVPCPGQSIPPVITCMLSNHWSFFSVNTESITFLSKEPQRHPWSELPWLQQFRGSQIHRRLRSQRGQRQSWALLSFKTTNVCSEMSGGQYQGQKPGCRPWYRAPLSPAP